MKLLFQISLALLSINQFLAGSLAAPSLRPMSTNRLTKRDLPSEIQNWNLYQAWDSYSDQRPPELEVPFPDFVSEGRLDDNDKTKLLYQSDCEDKVATLQSKISAHFATIFKGTLSPSDQPEVAIKRSWSARYMVIYGGSLQDQFAKHPNIAPVLDIVYQKKGRETGYLIMPWFPEGSLESHLDSYKDQAAVNDVFKQAINAVEALHGKNIMHRDIKPENFMVDGGTLKLTDFDSATTQSNSREYNVGTLSYLAPEILALGIQNKDPYNNKVDVFSLGMIWLVMSIPELRHLSQRLLLWKDLIEKNGKQWLTASEIEDILKSYKVFQSHPKLLKIIARALCEPGSRYTVKGFLSDFEDATKP